jgi:8-amino-7-oxononanoate synthase
VRIDGRDVIMLSSNNYLGLADHPQVAAAAKDAIDRYGLGTAAARGLAGNTLEHETLERELAAFKTAEAALLFNSGYAGNVGTIAALMGPEDVIFSDASNHGSIVDGCRLSRATVIVYPHQDMNALERSLQGAAGYKQRMIVSDTVFSMEGSVAPLRDIATLAEHYGAFVMVDEAHATGVLGTHGGGAVESEDVVGRVAVVLGTLGKALGTVGGYVVGSRSLIEFLRHKARSLLFTTSLPAACAAASRAALHLMNSSPHLRDRLWENTRLFQRELHGIGLNTLDTRTPIVPILVGDADRARRLNELLLNAGVHTQAIGYPYVPAGTERLRTIVTGAHTREDLEHAVQAIALSSKAVGLL